MKRFLVTILALLYMAGATGATVHIHYCMDRLIDISLDHSDDDRCGKCGMKEDARKKGCCKDEHKTFKTSVHQLAKASFDIQQQYVAVLPQSFTPAYAAPVYSFVSHKISWAHAPPAYWRTCPIYIRVCNFRI